MANASNAPTNVKVFPIPAKGVEVRATFTATNGLPATYARFQISTDPNFGTTVYDSGQVSINPINDGAEGVIVFTWVPSSQGTYYYRLCFWDNSNYTLTNFTVWNGAVIGESSVQTATIRPVADSSVALSIYPTTPTTHYDKVDETIHNDATDYVYNSGSGSQLTDKFTCSSSGIDANYLKRISGVKVVIWVNGNDLTNTVLYMVCQSNTYGSYLNAINTWEEHDYTWTKNPNTNLDWTLNDVNSVIIGVDLYAGSGGGYNIECTQVYAEISYYNYTVIFTPPGNNILNIGYPSVSSIDINNNQENFTFTVQIQDTYTKPPMVTLNVDNKGYVMDYVSRVGSGPYTYTFSKTLPLETGQHQYQITISNVWTTLVSNTYNLYANYQSNKDVKIYVDNKQINAWNIILTENLLPDVNEATFITDNAIDSTSVELRVKTGRQVKFYQMQIKNNARSGSNWQYTVYSTLKKELKKTISYGAQVTSSQSLLQKILPAYSIFGNLTENIYFQQFTDKTIAEVLSYLIMINQVRMHERNGKIYILEDTNPTYTLRDLEKQGEDRDNIINIVREYYKLLQTPVPATALTEYDASNWAGTVVNAIQTSNGILPPSNSPYMLKATGEIYRSNISITPTDYDRFHLNWNPDSATSLTIKLETDTSNYYSYTRTFAGGKGAGFVLLGGSAQDVVSKTIAFGSTKLVSNITGQTSDNCSYKIQLKLSGSIVLDTGWLTTFQKSFNLPFFNTNADTIVLYFTNLYPIGTSYGVNCQQLSIQEYANVVVSTQKTETIVTGQSLKGSGGVDITYNAPTFTLHAKVAAGSAYSVSGNQSLMVNVYGFAINYFQSGITKGAIVGASWYTENGILYLEATMTVPGPDNVDYAWCSYDVWEAVVTTTYTPVYGWQYITYAWQQTYNLFDSIDIPLSSFSKTGSPTTINTIRLTATGDNYYDALYLYNSNPQFKYVEVRDQDSINQYGENLEERKLDGWTSYESAYLFANQYLNIVKDPIVQYQKDVSLETPVEIGDPINCEGTTLYAYKINYDFDKGIKTLFVGRSLQNTLELLKLLSKKVEALGRNIT
jgi:hypothetical protein